jgi:N-acetylmuramoyl-L-alanine amidase
LSNKFSLQKRIFILTTGIFFLFSLSLSLHLQDVPLLKSSVKDYPGYSRVILESSFPLSFSIEKSLFYVLVRMDAKLGLRAESKNFNSRLIESLGWTKGRDYSILAIKTKLRDFNFDYFSRKEPPQLVIDISFPGKEKIEGRAGAKPKKTTSNVITSHPDPAHPSKEGNPTSTALGIRTIVIDPGHGGLEAGAKGKFGTLEKNMTLAIGLKLKDIIERNLAFRVIMTREDDVDVSLEDRAASANYHKADLFISIHTNSSYRKEAMGSETFFLSLNATDEEARRLAYQENNPTDLERGIVGENQDDIEMILWDMAQTAFLKQSSQLAESIQKELNALLGTINRGIKQAPFKVLTGVACPAVLVEVVFISNPQEERMLLTENFQEEVARAIYRGVLKFTKIYSQDK